MKQFAGVLLIIAGVLLGLYVGVWLLFIGGIIGIIDVIADATNGLGIDGFAIGVNIVKMIFASFVGYVSGMVLAFPGFTMLIK